MQTVIFPDLEVLLVKEVKELLIQAGMNPMFFRVATQKLAPGKNVPRHQIIIRSEGGTPYDKVLKAEDITILLWTSGEQENVRYGEANALALLLEAVLPLLQEKVVNIVEVERVSVTPLVYEGEEELRDIDISIITRGKSLNI